MAVLETEHKDAGLVGVRVCVCVGVGLVWCNLVWSGMFVGRCLCVAWLCCLVLYIPCSVENRRALN